MSGTLRQLPAVASSLLFHVGLLAVFAAIKFQLLEERRPVAVQTIFEEKKDQEQLTQRLTVEKEVSKNLSLVSGGLQSTNVGALAEPPVQQTRIDQSESLQDPKVLNVGMIDMPGVELLGAAVGEGQVNGVVGAREAGYGSALSRISQELMRQMREQPVLAVWLFDASGSLADDRTEIIEEFHRVYKELNIAKEQADKRRQKVESIETMICMFGAGVTPLMREPTGDIEQVKKAIEAIKDDESGKENLFSAVSTVLDQYAKICLRTKRKLTIIVVSDESGDDGQMLEEVVQKAREGKAPVYFLGRESVFGYPYASVEYIDEATGYRFWPTISRGPETAEPEAMQWDGWGARHGRMAEHSVAGFGPYEQVRLARESGGIFFLLADLEENLAGGNVHQQYDILAMKEYRPLLLPRKEYLEQRAASPFRDSLWKIIATLNPNSDGQLNFGWRFSGERAAFTDQAKNEFNKAMRAIGLLTTAINQFKRIEPLRASEASQRWRAAYDLAYAQCLTYKVRMFQWALALDYQMTVWPKFQNERTNRLDRMHTQELRKPDERQLKLTGISLEEMEQARTDAIAAFDRVIAQHPGTPWAVRADIEKRRGFGAGFREIQYYPPPRDPNNPPPPRPPEPKL